MQTVQSLDKSSHPLPLSSEIWSNILQHVADFAYPRKDRWFNWDDSDLQDAEDVAYGALARLARVSRLLCTMASPLLYRKLRLDDKMANSAIVQLLISNEDVAARVTTLILGHDQMDENESEDEDGEQSDALDLRSILLACRNLHFIRIITKSYLAFPWTLSFAALDFPVVTCITSLDLPFGHDASTTTAQLLLMVPNLIYLALERRCPNDDEEYTHPALPSCHPQTRLEEFHLTCDEGKGNPLSGLSAIIAASRHSLKELSVSVTSEAASHSKIETLAQELADCSRFPAVEKLHLFEIREEVTPFGWIKLLNHFPALQHILVDFTACESTSRSFDHVSPCLEALCELRCTPLLQSISLNTPGIFKLDNFAHLKIGLLDSLQNIHLRSELLQKEEVAIPGLLESQEQFLTLVEQMQGPEIENALAHFKGCAVEIELGYGADRPLWKASNVGPPGLHWCHEISRTEYIEMELYPDF